MFGSIGGSEILFILVLALLLFGPRKLPEIGRTLARTMSEFRKATHDFRHSLEREIELDKLKEGQAAIDEVRTVVRNPLSVLDAPPVDETSDTRSSDTDPSTS